MTKHTFHLFPEPLGKIKSGQKTVELRLWDEKRRKVKVGDRVVFVSTENSAEKLVAEVRAIHRALDFAELLAGGEVSPDQLGYKTVAEALNPPNPIYSIEQQHQSGIVAFELILL
jgi:ASC-1-like (ASCH) protein